MPLLKYLKLIATKINSAFRLNSLECTDNQFDK